MIQHYVGRKKHQLNANNDSWLLNAERNEICLKVNQLHSVRMAAKHRFDCINK